MATTAGGMSNLRRMVVGLKRHESSDTILPAKFVDCIVNFFSPNELRVKVSYELKDYMLVLSPTNEACSEIPKTDNDIVSANCNMSSVILQHSPECPVLRLEDDDASQLSEKVLNQGVHVGVAVILESLDRKILLTQRAAHMRSFPRVWVPPGGHLEHGETLSKGAFRELEEETGLKFDFNEPQVQVLCLWESVFPVLLGFGVPKNHHIVTYFHLCVQQTSEQLQGKIKLDPEEVQAWTWLDEKNVQTLFESKTGDSGKVNKFCLETDGNISCSELDLSTMYHPTLWQEKKIYSGTQLALHCWLKRCQNSSALLSKM